MANGLTLDDVVFDRQKDKFDKDKSKYFWFTVLHKLYLYVNDTRNVNDPGKEKLRKAYANIATYLEENLIKDSNEHGKLARTAAFFLAVEEGDTEMVQNMLEKSSESYHQHFFTNMRALPGQVFTSMSYNDDPILITPVALALRKQDVKMLCLLCSHSWGKIPMFKGHPEVERNKVVSLCLYILRGDADFFKNPILTDLLNQPPDQRNASQIYSTSSVKWSLEVAEVFHAVETNNIFKLH